MQYQQFHVHGFPIGLDEVEGYIKQDKPRMVGAGMRRLRQGSDRLIDIRSAILSDTFADLWQQVPQTHL